MTTKTDAGSVARLIADAIERGDDETAERLVAAHPDNAGASLEQIRQIVGGNVAEASTAAASAVAEPNIADVARLRADLAESERRAARLRAAEAEVARARAVLEAAEREAATTEEEKAAERARQEAERRAALERAAEQLFTERVRVYERFDRATVELRDALRAVAAINRQLASNAVACERAPGGGRVFTHEESYNATESLRWRLGQAGLVVGGPLSDRRMRQLGDVPVPDSLADESGLR